MASCFHDRATMIELLKACGKDLIDNAEQYVDDAQSPTTDFTVWIRIPTNSMPEIEVQQTHVSKECYQVLAEAYRMKE